MKVQAVDALGQIIGMSPLERPDPGLVAALADAGALAVLDLGRGPRGARALATIARRAREFGVRVPDGASVSPTELPANARVVICAADDVARYSDRIVLAQVVSLDEARRALAAGAAGLVAKGSEAGGRVGEETAFVLLQQLAPLGAPVWVQGGIGLHTAAACIAGGAKGVVIDSQLALVRESSLGADVRAAIAAMDGSETVVIGGHRVYTRPDLPVASLSGDEDIRARLGGDDLSRDLLPLGQDAAFARAFADRAKTAAGVVRALRASIDAHLAQAAQLRPLAPGSPFAAQHALAYPIAQGPMSRVSDRAAFALAVAEGGGLPFLALTLMSGAETRALLEETRALLGDRTWGVGILGFVPPEVREAQLAVMADIKPPVALIAGGRPSQAAPLEASGTPTYLHVPSPGLLELFLKDGARRFVFEGRECGGHVGPRSSFALWDAQIERLLASPACGECSVLFAGGVHDARSAAMVAAMAAPLAARGARIGVLMGTAYLFTHEAVSSGAIQPGFQDEAIACERTVLLETAPGHATRCADTAFATAFAAEAARLESDGVPVKERWALLEQMNLGRLRIAAKGLRRDGAEIVSVEDPAQRAEGMYMIGQVAALRRATCSIAELHHDVSAAGAELLGAVDPVVATAKPADVAIVGLAAIFAGAPDTDAFWANIVGGKNAIREVPPERWSVEQYYDPNATGANAGEKTPCKWGGFLDDVRFDPLAYGIPPRSLEAIEPVQLLALEIAKRALADAGYVDREFDRARTSVIFGAEAGTDLSTAYGFRAMYPHYVGPLPAALDDALPSLSEDSFPGVLSNVIAGRIANRLDLGGVNYTVDAACAASLAAVDMAVKELALGTSDMVLCGGADLHNSINDYLLFSSVHALSPTGQCHTFDAKADGIVLGEGVACVVLKRLADAERDGDRIYAVIKGVAGASDGKSLGLTAPRKEGQIRALERAYAQAGVSPTEIGLVEAHGTGTIVGDRTELGTLTDVYTKAGAAPGACVLGSVKSQIGHTKCAAGMAGIIKAALSIHHGVLPPTSNLESPNPAWKRDASPFRFLDAARPWRSHDRKAAVSAFGFGGTNFHAVLAAAPSAVRASSDAWPSELFLIRAESPAAAARACEQLAAAIAPGARLRDLARTVCASGSGPVQIAVVADDVEDLRAKLYAARELRADRRGVFVAGGARGPIAFLCSGQGSQKPGMLAELFVAFPRLAKFLELGERWADRIFPPAAFSDDERAAQAAAITDTRVAQPALGVADLAIADLLASFGVEPDMAAGHSYGELAALCIAGAIDERDLLPLSEARGVHILDAARGGDPGTMVAVAARADKVAPIADAAGVVIANHNAPSQCVLSGPTAAIEAAMPALAAAGLTAKRIPVACAFHSPVVAGAQLALAERLSATTIAAPRVPVFANATAAPYPTAPDDVRALLASQVARPVRFAEEIEAMYAAGARVFVECGPGQVLTRLVAEILGDRPHVAVACDASGGSLRAFQRALAALAVAGVAIDWTALFADRDAAIVELEPARAAKPSQVWLVNGHRARPEAGAPAAAPARPVVLKDSKPEVIAMPSKVHTPTNTAAPVASSARDRDAVVIEYLRGVRELVAAQRDVMMSYLGAAPAVVYASAPAHAPVIDVVEQRPLVLSEGPSEARPESKEAPVDPMQLVLAIVSERTGYPIDTLGVDLDLEADLSIDSIKRIEIIGELAERLGLRVKGGAGDDKVVEELAARKTLRSLVAWLTERLAKTETAAAPAPAPAAPAPAPVTPAINRFVFASADAPAPVNGHHSFAGLRFAIIDDGRGIGAQIAQALAAEGAHAALATDIPDTIHALIDVSALAEHAPADPVAALTSMYARVRAAVLAGADTVFVATSRAADRGGGAAGLLKTFAVEFPALRARAIDVDLAAPTAELATAIRLELTADDGPVEIAHHDGNRTTRVAIAATAPAPTRPLVDERAVVLITGGARGITAKVAIALAERHRCALELVGRSPLPGPEDPALAGAADAPAIRRALLERSKRPPAEIELACARVLADREIRATLAAIERAGSPVTYHAVDVREPAFAAVLDDVYRRRGRIDGVIHGAGILDDKLVKQKSPDAFARVVSTKLAGARTLAAGLRPDTKFVALFASISGAFGNRGQVDYATANDALDVLAASLQAKINGRVVSIDWGPWAGAGMVSPELEREYARRGLGLVDPARGIDALLAELASGARDAQVVLMAGEPSALAAASERTTVHHAPAQLDA